ncbi:MULTISPECIES: hypothetical protein [unclassified Klebsiella]|uniref:hypothetical protein n=1 Tax=unclassified Klebsiella TaxID=2608929 RepID=UPI000C2ABCAA|nr:MULTISPECIES: hypothetical protein [unclassified Klebsiella]PJX59527.1 hypothetical protein CWM63_09565 [Klebsiella sp. F-Nf9]PKJ69073.1 hypothetical protein CW267_19245 [Klebsiella sp. X1-16S-Nf21]
MIPPFAVWSLSMFNDAIVYDRYGPPAAVLTLKRLPLAPLAGDLVFDAVGGELANTLLSVLPASSILISYGLLSGQPLTQTRGSATVRKFHLREALPTLSVAAWRAAFDEIWLRLPTTTQPPAQRIALNDWREAITAADQPGRGGKILLDFTAG